MNKVFKNQHIITLYPEGSKEKEFPCVQGNYRECRMCGAVYYKKSWHHPRNIDIGAITRMEMLWVSRCPACKMIENHEYEGVLTLMRIPKRFQNELFHLIKAYTKRAYDEDCQHRLIGLMKKDASTWSITLTENQLANKLAQKIKDVFKNVSVRVMHSKAPHEIERVTVTFSHPSHLAPP